MNKILQILYDFNIGGSERLAVFISYGIKNFSYDTALIGLYGGGDVISEIQKNKVKYKYFTYRTNFERRFLVFLKIYFYLKKENFDLIQVHGAYPLSRVIIPAKLTKTKIIYTEHAKQSISKSKRLKLITKICARFCDKIVVVSNNLKDYFIKDINVDKNKIEVIHNGVDLNKFDPNINYPLKEELKNKYPNNIFFGIVGRLTEAKDHETLIKAWKKLHDEYKKIKLFIVGDGELKHKLIQIISSYNLEDSVILLGQRDDIPNFINAMDIMILSSKREGLPISILEYMAMKRPTIATDVGGVKEILNHKINGYLIKPENHLELFIALKTYLEERDKFNLFCDKGRKVVEEKFSSKNMLIQYNQLFKNIIKK